MAVGVTCRDCRWSEEMTAHEIPRFCPQCGEDVIRASDPESPDVTKTDKI